MERKEKKRQTFVATFAVFVVTVLALELCALFGAILSFHTSALSRRDGEDA